LFTFVPAERFTTCHSLVQVVRVHLTWDDHSIGISAGHHGSIAVDAFGENPGVTTTSSTSTAKSYLGYRFSNITISTADINVSAPRGFSPKQEGRPGTGDGNDTQRATTSSNRIPTCDNKALKSDRLYWFLVLLIALGSTLFAASSTPWLSLGVSEVSEDSLTTAGRFRTEPVGLQESPGTLGEGNWVVPVTEGSPVEAFISNINAKLSSIASVATSITQRASSISAEPETTGRLSRRETSKRESSDKSMPGEYDCRQNTLDAC
jgi:hypothetical protein